MRSQPGPRPGVSLPSAAIAANHRESRSALWAATISRRSECIGIHCRRLRERRSCRTWGIREALVATGAWTQCMGMMNFTDPNVRPCRSSNAAH